MDGMIGELLKLPDHDSNTQTQMGNFKNLGEEMKQSHQFVTFYIYAPYVAHTYIHVCVNL